MRTPRSSLHRRRSKQLALLALALVATGGARLWASDERGRGRVAEAVVDGAIDPGSGQYIKDAITRAERHHYEALIIQLNTPGGLVDTTREIVDSIFASKVPVIVYVAPVGAHAGSAGVFITLAAHIAAMAPSTNIGAAHPIMMGIGGGGGGDKKDQGDQKTQNDQKDESVNPPEKKPEWAKSDHDILKRKIENDVSAFAKSIATERGRNVEWAVKAVRESDAIPAEQAVKMKVVDLIASSRDDLLAKIDGRTVLVGPEKAPYVLHTKGAPVDELSWSLKSRFLHTIGDPNIASILIMLGMAGLLIEFYKPGAIVPGVMGAILLLIGVIGASTLPINAGGVALLILGVGLAVTEFFYTSHGILGVAGAISFGIGALLLVKSTGDNFFADRSFGVNPYFVLPTMLFAIGAAMYVGYKAVRARMLKPVVGTSGMLGEVGEVDVDIGPGHEGKLLVHGEIWRAISDRPMPKGVRAKVVEVSGLTVRVEPEEG